MNKTPYDNGIEVGIEVGREEGREEGIVVGKEKALRDVAIALLESKYRSVPKPFQERIGSLGYDDLLRLVVRIPVAPSMESLFLPN